MSPTSANAPVEPRGIAARLLQGARALIALLSSFGLASALFVWLLVLTYLGTLDQVTAGLLHAQQTYFASFLLLHPVFGFPIPLPGAYLVLLLLFVNISLGTLRHLRRGWAHLGMLMVHGGILVLLLGAFVSFHYAYGGQMTLRQGQPVNYFERDHDWELVLTAPNATEDTPTAILPGALFADLSRQESRPVELQNTPFTLEIFGYQPEAMLLPDGAVPNRDAPVVDGFFLAADPPDAMPGPRAPGLYLHVTPKGESVPQTVLLWGLQENPATLPLDSGVWQFALRRTREALPFTLTLDAFTREVYPGTNTPRAFSSTITRTEGPLEERVLISMNQPMRYKGYVFYQSSWGPQNAGPGVERYSILAVAHNPADRFPRYACAFVALGMTVHFATKLIRHVRREMAGETR